MRNASALTRAGAAHDSFPDKLDIWVVKRHALGVFITMAKLAVPLSFHTVSTRADRAGRFQMPDHGGFQTLFTKWSANI
jgi:hypothetical protein